jgi:hypothetical protein
MNAPALLALAKANQPVVAALLDKVDAAVKADPKVLTDVLGLVDGSVSALGFAKAHPAVVGSLVAVLLPDHPQLFSELLAAAEGS